VLELANKVEEGGGYPGYALKKDLISMPNPLL